MVKLISTFDVTVIIVKIHQIGVAELKFESLTYVGTNHGLQYYTHVTTVFIVYVQVVCLSKPVQYYIHTCTCTLYNDHIHVYCNYNKVAHLYNAVYIITILYIYMYNAIHI